MAKYKAYPEYKDSGVEWLGDIPVHWGSKPLKFLCTCNDQVISDSTEKDYELEYVDIGSVSSSQGITKTENMIFSNAPSRARRLVKDGDVIISTVRTYLEAIAPIINPPNNMVVSTGFAVIRPLLNLDKGFAAYCLRASGFIKEVVARSVGVSYPAINASDLVNIPIPNCSLYEQSRVAAFLDHETAKIDKLIEKQQQLIELLKEKRQAVISHAVTKGLNPDVPMKDSGVEWLGEVPEHWIVSPLKIHVFTRKGIAFKSTDFCHYGVRVVKASDIKQKSIQTSDVFLPELFALNYPKAILNSGDIVLSTVGSTPDVKNSAVGQIGLVPQNLNGSLLNQNTVVFSSRPDVLNQSYLFFLIQTNVYRDHLDLHAHGTANQASLNITDMLDFKYACPPLIEQVEISGHIQKYNYSFDLLESKSESAIKLLKERRTALISAAVTGKIDVRDWVAPDTHEVEVLQEVTA
ncbi:restriction endonuclease subunit S [Yersinia kristensenii]|uniref:restriction endonuclease subunit S n=1 Tax=Yersinia kristensenii TaxID=28152 RepID=UPI0002DBC4E4|nr:restriction endonuclease subunit S [Yersinia kristensenii]PEH53861.1 restriction endonuclease subunit S [Yersinia kristensenii]SUP67665.1 Type I restriction enzyme EcoKI specificity protein [Yersinia kristensenii]